MGPDVLNERQERARRMRHEDGATYNPFDDPAGRGTPWALEVMPLPLTAEEWEGLETGLIQRARLLETILADTYGPQNLVKEGWLPPELVFDQGLGDIFSPRVAGNFVDDWTFYTYDEVNYSDTNEIHLKPGQARRWYSMWDYEAGYYFFNYSVESGHFWDYLGAVYGLIESTAYRRGMGDLLAMGSARLADAPTRRFPVRVRGRKPRSRRNR